MKRIFLVVGIDISKDDFHVCIKEKLGEGKSRILGSHTFSNGFEGFTCFIEWVAKRKKDSCEILFVMEATGSYYEDLAYFLHEKGEKVSVELANKIKHFSKSLNLKSKTDKIDACTIAEIGIERRLSVWVPMSLQYKQMRDLCRELLSLKKECSRAKCQLHAMMHSHEKNASVIEIKGSQIEFYQKTILQIETEIEKSVNADQELKKRIERIEKVKGLGLITIVIVLCETNGFLMFKNIKQVVSYAGLDVVLKESGKYKGKTKISKKGNLRIRQCLYMPALTAIQHNESIKNLHQRIVERNPDIKKKGVIAGMRKLLVLIFVLWKKNEEYNPKYVWCQ
jgi:transposase